MERGEVTEQEVIDALTELLRIAGTSGVEHAPSRVSEGQSRGGGREPEPPPSPTVSSAALRSLTAGGG
jgi:hypothetical protein